MSFECLGNKRNLTVKKQRLLHENVTGAPLQLEHYTNFDLRCLNFCLNNDMFYGVTLHFLSTAMKKMTYLSCL